MNNEEAKLFLQAYRPSGEDAGDPIFAEALEQARRDPEMGRWLAEQRAFDDTMRAALQVEQPPQELREAIRLARKVVEFPPTARRPVWRHPGLLALAATLVAILGITALLVSRVDTGEDDRMTVARFTQRVLDLKRSGGISLGKMSSDQAEVRAWLAERGAPSSFELPPGLRNVPGLGCQSYTMDGIKVSLICFMLRNDQVVHLFVVDKGALVDAATDLRPTVQAENGLAWATWTSGGKSFILLGRGVTEETLRRLV